VEVSEVRATIALCAESTEAAAVQRVEDNEKRPSRDFVTSLARRASRDVAKQENPVVASLLTDAFGRAPKIPATTDVPDPLCKAAAPIRGMRPRNELVYEEKKEKAREFRRVWFDHDYWANIRCSSRLFFSVLSMPRSQVLRAILPPVLFVTAIACATTLGLEIPVFLLPLPTWTHFFPIKISSDPATLTFSSLALLVIFRTNNSAKRHNEARVMWGHLLQRSRDLVRQAITFFPEAAVHKKATLARWTMVFALTLKCHLRPGQDLVDHASKLLAGHELQILLSAEHKVRRPVNRRTSRSAV
jgi:hypothetical protein